MMSNFTNYIQLEAYGDVTVIREATEPVWDRDDTSTNWTVCDLRLSRKDTDNCIPNTINATVGETVYAIYAIWSDGDSFGHDTNRCCELLSVHRDYETALRNQKILETAKGFDVEIQQDHGKPLKVCVAWGGYFESLTSITVESFRLRGERN